MFRELLSKIFALILKVIKFISVIIIGLIDSNLVSRLYSGRYSMKDFLPFIFSVIIMIGISIGYKLELIGVSPKSMNSILPDMLRFQGTLFASSLTTSIFVLSILKSINVEDKATFEDIVDDLRISNKIVFIALIVIFFFWILATLIYIELNPYIYLAIITFVVWSLLEIASIIRGVFLLVKLK